VNGTTVLPSNVVTAAKEFHNITGIQVVSDLAVLHEAITKANYVCFVGEMPG
jgi:hypothetical protein